MEDWQFGLVFGFVMFIMFGLMMVGSTALINWKEGENCRVMQEQGFATKIEYTMVFIANCYIYDNQISKFIPLDKFRAFAD